MKIFKIILITIVILFIASCAPQKPVEQSSATEASSTATVDISDFAFVPDTITIKRGGTVTWIQKDSVPHTVAIEGIPESPSLNQGDTWSYTLDKTGSYKYICSIHPSMEGKIIVK